MNSLTFEELGSAAQRDRRKRILDATIALASKGGFDAVQMRAVAEQADVALGTLYRYFPSKIHLLVSALAREFEKANASFDQKPVPGDTTADRVMYVLSRTTRALQRDPNLTEALTRAFMFADASVATEIQVVGMQVTRMLMRAMHDPESTSTEVEPTEEDIAIAKVIGDVWLASLVQWVTGRASAADVSKSMDVAVRLLLRD
ncbi:MAG TPA: cholesterol catabolism transcriptional regulator KstR [Nocardioidaceae bacterium]|nr:cholesterol catabolism transcriptional regulator KstR [Nocardioidaceae bacterium]